MNALGLRAALLALVAGALGLTLLACGGDDTPATVKNVTATGGSSTGGTEGGSEVTLGPPANRYAPAVKDLPAAYIVHQPETYGLNLTSFSVQGPFKTPKEGETLAAQWGFADGWRAAFDPDGLLAGVLEGRYYVTVETYLFATIDGARQAFQQFDAYYASAPGSQKQTAKGLGNQSDAFKLISGTVGSSAIAGAYHHFLFRRGNMVATVQTFGGEPFMTIAQARDIAVLVDDRALGKRPATEPTPFPTPALPPVVPTPKPQ